MSEAITQINPQTLKSWLHDGEEVALLDTREEVPFDARHLLFASCVPLSQLEFLLDALVPRRSTRIVWCDDGEGLAEMAAILSISFGYANVHLLEGGVTAWEQAGYPVYSGVHVPSKAFAEVVEYEAKTPHISADELKALIDENADIAIYDTRTYEEYNSNSIPGAVSVPGVELVYRFADLMPSADTMIVVNCGGRTRSIIGAQALLNAGVPNKVVSLKNGTQDWHLFGYEVVEGATRRHPENSLIGLKLARTAAAAIADRFDIQTIDAAELATWRDETDERNLYVLDVRTPEEYEAGHLPDTRSAPGGQLVQETDKYLAAWGGRVVLVDNDGVRATVTASWLLQMGWKDTVVLTFDPAAGDLDKGTFVPIALGYDEAVIPTIDVSEAKDLLAAGMAQIVDLADSKQFRQNHIPGAWYAIRARLAKAMTKLPDTETVIFTSPDGTLAGLTARDRGGNARALSGGTAAWIAAGLPTESGANRLASAPDDIRLKAREAPDGDIEKAMRAYLAWEIDLVNQMARDGDHRFQVMTD